jgi:hypothetical protein
VVVDRVRIHRLSWANEVGGAEEAYVKYFHDCVWRRLRHTGRHQHSCDVGSFPALAQRSDEKPPDRCSPGGWVFVCDSALHHGLQPYSMRQRLVGVGISGHLSAHLVLHIVLVLVLVPLLFLKILIARPLQAEPFVAEGTGNSNIGNFNRACVHSHSLGTYSFGETSRLGVKARDRLDCYSVPGPMRLGVYEEEAATCFRRVIAYSMPFGAALVFVVAVFPAVLSSDTEDDILFVVVRSLDFRVVSEVPAPTAIPSAIAATK